MPRPPTASCNPGMFAAAVSVSSGTKTTTYPGRKDSPTRFGAGATRKRPFVPVSGPATGVAATPIEAGRAIERRGHIGFAAQIDSGQGQGREAGHQRRRQIGGARSGGNDAVSLVGCHDRLAGSPLVLRTL